MVMAHRGRQAVPPQSHFTVSTFLALSAKTGGPGPAKCDTDFHKTPKTPKSLACAD